MKVQRRAADPHTELKTSSAVYELPATFIFIPMLLHKPGLRALPSVDMMHTVYLAVRYGGIPMPHFSINSNNVI